MNRSGFGEGDFEEDKGLFGGDDDGVGNVEARLIQERQIVLEIEEQITMDGAHGRDDIGVERERADDVEKFLGFLVADR